MWFIFVFFNYVNKWFIFHHTSLQLSHLFRPSNNSCFAESPLFILNCSHFLHASISSSLSQTFVSHYIALLVDQEAFCIWFYVCNKEGNHINCLFSFSVLGLTLRPCPIKVVRNKTSKVFSHRHLIEFYETNRMSHVPHLYDVVNLLK